MDFSGSYVALITPFDRKGRLDKKALEKLVEWQIAEGTNGIVCSATTGEGPCLSDADRKNIAEICIRTAAGRVPTIVSTGTSDTRTTIRYTTQAKKQGASGCLVVTPYYNRPTQWGCILHYREVAKVGLPVIIYHNPPRAALRLTVESVREMSQIPHIAGFKDSSRDLDFVKKIAPYIRVFAGDDDVTVEILRSGGVGAISPTANIVPRAWKQIVALCLKGKWKEAESLLRRYVPLCKALFAETNPQVVKFALSQFRRCTPLLRLPLTVPSEPAQIAVKEELIRLALFPFSKRTHTFK